MLARFDQMARLSLLEPSWENQTLVSKALEPTSRNTLNYLPFVANSGSALKKRFL